jgi:hypothetical protein
MDLTMGAPSFKQDVEQGQITHGYGVAPAHIPLANAPWYTDLHGWGAVIGGVAAVLAAWGTFRGLTRRKNSDDT